MLPMSLPLPSHVTAFSTRYIFDFPDDYNEHPLTTIVFVTAVVTIKPAVTALVVPHTAAS